MATMYTDGRMVVKIDMSVWNGSQYGPSFEKDFFENGTLDYIEQINCYCVDDVEELIDQATDWKLGVGDYVDELEGETGHTPEDRHVETEIEWEASPDDPKYFNYDSWTDENRPNDWTYVATCLNAIANAAEWYSNISHEQILDDYNNGRLRIPMG